MSSELFSAAHSDLGGQDSGLAGLQIDVPTQLDVLPDGSQSVTIGDVGGYRDFNHQQGDNPYGIQQDCGLVSCQDVLNQFGVPVAEADVVGHAVNGGECQYDASSPADSGGSSPDDQARILSDYGIPAHVESGESLEDLAGHVEEGQGTIVGVNAGVLWNDANAYENGQANHAVTVTGVARDPMTGQIQGFYINDSGDGKSGEFVPASVMQQAWQDTGGASVVTDAVHTAQSTSEVPA
jgi:hypothetical protein